MNQRVFKTINHLISEKWETYQLEYITFCNNRYCITESKLKKDYVISEQFENGNLLFHYQGNDVDKAVSVCKELISNYFKNKMN